MESMPKEPTTLGELQLYKVLQRANLLGYYDVFISHGGDDVQQLCEAGEEEFLEIMALIGMASKPLHVRRFQKALQDWVTSPQLFQDININYRPPQSLPLSSLGVNVKSLLESKMNGNYQSKTSNPHSMNHSDPNKEKTGFTTISAHQSRDQDASTKFFTSSTHKSLSDAISRITKNQSSNCTPKVEENGALDEETIKLIAKVSSEEIKKHYPDKLTYEDALEHIKSSSKKRPHLVRVLEMRNGNSKDKELRRLASLFPTHFSNRTASNLTHFEIMCNEASMQICQAHPTLLTIGREERLKIAQFVVNKTNKLLLSSTDKNLAGMSNNSFSEEQLTTKLNEIRSQIDAFKLKMSEAETNKNYVTVLEYQSELARLGFKEKAIISLQKKTSKSDSPFSTALNNGVFNPTESQSSNDLPGTSDAEGKPDSSNSKATAATDDPKSPNKPTFTVPPTADFHVKKERLQSAFPAGVLKRSNVEKVRAVSPISKRSRTDDTLAT